MPSAAGFRELPEQDLDIPDGIAGAVELSARNGGAGAALAGLGI